MKFSIVLSALFAAIAIASPTGPAAEGNEVRGVNDVFDAYEARACKLRDGHCSSDSQCCSKRCVKRYPSAPSARCS
ncbi:hypothetical protein HG530_003890 [Fusarium avenaceum]|nr:hypothetical protein HG530_003890 [Fusarium avenaceum]